MSQMGTAFDLTRPYLTDRALLVSVVRRLDSPSTPASYVLDPVERAALMENARLIITRTLRSGSAASARNVAARPRWRFIGQIPEARTALVQAFAALGVDPGF